MEHKKCVVCSKPIEPKHTLCLETLNGRRDEIIQEIDAQQRMLDEVDEWIAEIREGV